MEAVQFHPTGIFPAGILVTEGCRGDGGLLQGRRHGHRFMPDYEPEKKELASRDVVSRRMEEHIARARACAAASASTCGWTSRCSGRAHIERNLREVKEICHYFLGIDPAGLIPVRPAQHYTMGGVRTDHPRPEPTLKGLFAAGEAACWDMHGFNRLGGNSVAETVVAGMIVGECIADFCDRRGTLRHPAGPGARVRPPRAGRLSAMPPATARRSAFELPVAMQDP
jgi:fumarate reductase flavoprotein subunit